MDARLRGHDEGRASVSDGWYKTAAIFVCTSRVANSALAAFKMLAAVVLAYDDAAVAQAIAAGVLTEV